jgi:hypothetical protein
MATYYKTNGEVKEVSPKNGKWFSYDELKEFVGGLIEIVPLPSGKSVVVNEEGKMIGLEKNEKASEEWLKEYPYEKYPENNDGTIAGDALIATDQELEEPEEDDGEIDEDVAGASQNGER